VLAIEEGSILDEEYVAGLGKWDVVYAWGVLHHTGSMWRSLELAQTTVDDQSMMFVSIYNDQGYKSRLWRGAKRTYNRLPTGLREPFAALVLVPRELLSFGMAVMRARPMSYIRGWTDYKRSRGVSRWHDLVDLIGGYPFEVAKPEEVFTFLKARGFQLERLVTCGGGVGCNQYVFIRPARAAAPAPLAAAARMQ
jgi:hypothetical protein